MKRKRLIALVAGLVLAGVYCGFYIFFRSHKEIVHHKSWSSHNHHSIQVEGPDGRLAFVGCLLAAADGTNSVDNATFDLLFDETMRISERRRKTLSIVFAPLRWTETCFWYVVDFRRDY